jgi:hypothetical protein
MSLLTGPPDSTGGCQSALVDELGVSPSRYHHAMIHIAITWGEQQARRGRSSETSVSPHHKNLQIKDVQKEGGQKCSMRNFII